MLFPPKTNLTQQYIPYFAAAMLDANDTEYFDVQGTLLIDPAISIDVNLVERMSNPQHHYPLSLKTNG